MMENKLFSTAVMLLMIILAFSMATSTVMGGTIIPKPPEPEILWKNTDSTGDVADVAIGDLNGDMIADVAFIDGIIPNTVFAVYGNNGTVYWQNISVAGNTIATEILMGI